MSLVMLTVTPSAEKGLRDLLNERGADPATTGLRLSVSRGGCAGMQYEMGLGEPSESDEIVDCGGAKVAVDAGSLQYLDGCTLDYADDLAGAGFRVINPKAARSCGCGTSFEPAS